MPDVKQNKHGYGREQPGNKKPGTNFQHNNNTNILIIHVNYLIKLSELFTSPCSNPNAKF